MTPSALMARSSSRTGRRQIAHAFAATPLLAVAVGSGPLLAVAVGSGPLLAVAVGSGRGAGGEDIGGGRVWAGLAHTRVVPQTGSTTLISFVTPITP
jgi:hypothetical protein